MKLSSLHESTLLSFGWIVCLESVRLATNSQFYPAYSEKSLHREYSVLSYLWGAGIPKLRVRASGRYLCFATVSCLSQETDLRNRIVAAAETEARQAGYTSDMCHRRT